MEFEETIDRGMPGQDFMWDGHVPNYFNAPCPYCLDRFWELWQRAKKSKRILLRPAVVGSIASSTDLNLIIHPRRT